MFIGCGWCGGEGKGVTWSTEQVWLFVVGEFGRVRTSGDLKATLNGVAGCVRRDIRETRMMTNYEVV